MNIDLFVTAGPNRGAYVPIGAGRYTVGVGEDSDIVLEGASPTGNLIIDVTSDRVRVTPASGALARLNGRVLGRGGAAVEAGAVIDFGDAEFRVFWEGADGAGQSVGGRSRAGWGLRILGILAVLAGTGLFLAESWQQDLRRPQQTSETIKPNIKTVSPDGVGAESAPSKQARIAAPLSGSMLEGVEARVKSVLRGTGLSGKLEQGRLVISGSVLTAKDEKRLEAMIAELRPYVDVDVSAVRGMAGGNVNPAPSAQRVVAPARIVAINIVDSGLAKSYFETQDGARYFEGAIFGEGYVVSEIRPTSVSMEKGGVRVEYPLTGR